MTDANFPDFKRILALDGYKFFNISPKTLLDAIHQTTPVTYGNEDYQSIMITLNKGGSVGISANSETGAKFEKIIETSDVQEYDKNNVHLNNKYCMDALSCFMDNDKCEFGASGKNIQGSPVVMRDDNFLVAIMPVRQN